MNEQEYLDTYNGQSINELLELENKFEPYEIIYVLELALDNKKDSDKKLSDSEMTVLAVQALDREVNNGGFQQFFYNSMSKIIDRLFKFHNKALERNIVI
ncbi:MAG: DUF4375 domain-containing protein [Campylobacterota bacterium]|nr:DUF4375 domain-containing protein [Campylobacterota bacterium]